MLDHFFRMNPAGSPGRLELARLVRQNTVDVYVPTTQFYTNDRGEVTRQSIRRASVWNPDTQEPLKITREGGFYILAHQSNDENLDGFPAFQLLQKEDMFSQPLRCAYQSLMKYKNAKQPEELHWKEMNNVWEVLNQ